MKSLTENVTWTKAMKYTMQTGQILAILVQAPYNCFQFWEKTSNTGEIHHGNYCWCFH